MHSIRLNEYKNTTEEFFRHVLHTLNELIQGDVEDNIKEPMPEIVE